jgi:hypothetical protein
MPATPQCPDNLLSFRYLTGTNFEDSITATAGGGQANAYALTAQMSRVSVVASGNDSVALPKASIVGIGAATPGGQGFVAFVRNDGANSMQVFGATPDTINGAATGTGVSVGAGKSAIFWLHSITSAGLGNWLMVLSA